MYLTKRNHYKVTLFHQRMWDFKVALVNGQIVVEQDVDVDRTVGVGDRSQESGVSRFLPATQLAFDLLGGFEKLTGSEFRFAEDDSIEKLILRLKSPGFSLDK